MIRHGQTFWLGSRWALGLDSEFNSIHFGIIINGQQMFKIFVDPKNFWVQKIKLKFKKIFLRSFKFVTNFWNQTIFGSQKF